MTKRIRMSLDEIRKESLIYQQTKDKTLGIYALVDVEDMGYCRDGVTRWYHFTNEAGQPAIYFKY